jgi:hypothetical protein
LEKKMARALPVEDAAVLGTFAMWNPAAAAARAAHEGGAARQARLCNHCGIEDDDE